MTVDVDLDLAPLVVALRVARLVAEQILVRQLVEQIGEGGVQLVDAVGEDRSAGSVALRVSGKITSLKPSSVTASCGGTSPRNCLTAFFSFGIAGAMLPEMSIATTSSSGTSSDAKCVTSCLRPSSKT